MELTHFNKAKNELMLATKIDEVKEIRDKAEALKAYMKQAGESLEMQNYCAEIKIRAERRAGELIPEQIERGRPEKTLHDERIVLKDLNISEIQSHRWQAIAAVPEEEFEEHIAKTKAENKELTSASVYRLHKKRSVQTPPLPTEKYRVILADPPWKYGNTMPDYFKEQADHYPLLTVAEICDIPVKDIVEDNAVLFLWTTSPILEESFQVVKSWGFTYKASFVWDKVKHNMGHYNSVRHEFLLVCTRGSCQPDIQKLFDSVVIEERTEHSKKPELFYEIIETLYTHGKKIELFSRKTREGWASYGNEVS
ncbi:MAG TPA: MT-A70 family methyltransferase [Candidatus Wunengus sp. YC60]|jgi:N6-adenosine-specific RNA methylase IME4|uniref:MT-A70 family methyltransferase n=1 Tax=Candidatus Wunengus sp. YC60 TaxID=3367697 RepID=UPI0040291A5F